jgi:Tfp pilus assembly protein PilO
MNRYQIAQQSWQIKIIIVASICLCFAMSGFYFFIKMPLIIRNQYLSLLTTAEQHWQYLQKNHAANNKLSTNILQQLHEHLIVDELMTITTTLATQSGLILLSLRPTNQHKLKKFAVERLTITANGNFQQFMHFYRVLLSLPYFITLPNWQLTRTHSQQLKLKLLIEVYHY